MNVTGTAPLRVASAVWRPRPDLWALTVVCKATFRLQPGVCALAEAPQEIVARDVHWEDDPSRSLRLAGDVVPFKPVVDVLLTGDAYAPGGRPVRSMIARLVVGALDKRISVWCDRLFWHDGSLLEGQPFARMPLRYERAAGGPGTENPVGVRWDAPPDARGAIVIPNLQPARARIARRGDSFPPIGFGPLGPSWPQRTSKLGAYAHLAARWREQPMPADFDAAYFNAAPPDQQLSELRPDEFMLLEGLHPTYPRLETSLPAERPIARFTSGSRSGEEIALTADTLAIDADGGVATVVYRGVAELRHPEEPGEITIALDGYTPAAAAGEPPVDGTKVLDTNPSTPALPFDPGGRKEVGTALGTKPKAATLPFVPRTSPWAVMPATTSSSAPAPGPADTGTSVIVRGATREPLPFPWGAPSPAGRAFEPPRMDALRVPAQRFDPPPMEPLRVEPPRVEPPRLEPVAPPAEEVAEEPTPAPPVRETEARAASGGLGLGRGLGSGLGLGAGAAEPAARTSPGPVDPEAEAKEVTLEQCAAVAASIARRPDDRASVLERAKLSAAGFAAAERRFTAELKEEAGRGKRALAQAYDAAYVRRLEEERGPIEVADYARLVVASERRILPAALDELGLPRGAMVRIERVWLQKATSDPAIGKAVSRAVKAAREA